MYICIFFSHYKVSLLIRKEKIYLFDIFSNFRGFQKQVFTYMYKAERNAIVLTRLNTSPNLSSQASVSLTPYSFFTVRYKARDNFREFEISVSVSKG